MRRADVASALVWLLMGGGVVYAGYDLELGSVKDPGSGFVLFWVGLVMVGLSLVVLVGAAVRADGTAAPPLLGARWPAVLAVLAALVLYGLALPRLGFLLTTTLVLLFLFKAVERKGWPVAIGGAVASAAVAYLVFRVWLGAQLPAGLLGFG